MIALVLAKVVLVLEHVPLGRWVERSPAITDVLLRTLFYGLGVLIILLIEKAFESRHEYEGFGTALANILHHPDMPHVWVNALCVAGALLGFNFLSVLRRHLGEHGLARIFLKSPPRETISEIPCSTIIPAKASVYEANDSFRKRA